MAGVLMIYLQLSLSPSVMRWHHVTGERANNSILSTQSTKSFGGKDLDSFFDIDCGPSSQCSPNLSAKVISSDVCYRTKFYNWPVSV